MELICIQHIVTCYFLKKLILHLYCFLKELQIYKRFPQITYHCMNIKKHLHNQPDIFLCQNIYDTMPGIIHASIVSIMGSNFPALATPE